MTAFHLRLKHMEWLLLFGIWALHGAVAFWQFVSISLETKGFLFGLSPQRLLVSGVLLTWLIFNLTLIFFALKKPELLAKRLERLESPRIHDGVLVTAASLAFFCISLLVFRGLFGQQLMKQYGGYIDLLTPVIHLMIYVSLEIIAVMVFRCFRDQVADKNHLRGIVWKTLVVLAVFCLVALIISSTGLGITTVYRMDWGFGVPAVPLLEWQILLACAFCVGMVVVETKGRIPSVPHLDFWIALLVWLGTVAIWLSHPVVPHPSALEPHAPNFEVYPFIDAQTYDTYAQSVLVGNGFGHEQVPPRPLYIVFLALLHALVGQDYGDVIAAQTLFFALFPVLLYFLGREFFGRPIGVAIALLAVLRDYTSNLVSPFTGNLSYSKVYLSEIPTAMLLILFVLIGVRWIKAGFPVYSGLLMGGVLGVGMLVRTQVIVALPVIALFALLVQPKKIVLIVRGALVMLLALIFTVSPWVWRNWKVTGELIFDSPAFQAINLAIRYSRINNAEPYVFILPGESVTAYEDRLWKIASDAISSNPKGAYLGVASYYLNHSVNNILLLPLRNEIKDFGELWTPTDAFWEKWTGKPTASQGRLIIFYASLLALGVAVAWHRSGWLGLVPLGLNLAYNLWTSLALLSGERFMLSMDWSISLYYMIGMFTLLSGFMFLLKGGRSTIRKWYEANPFLAVQPVGNKNWRNFALTGLLFLGVGAVVPLGEMAFPERYPLAAQDEILNRLLSAGAVGQSGLDAACLQAIVSDDLTRIIQGRALYPRFYDAGDGESFTDAVGYKIVDESRLVFEMVGQKDDRIVIPMSREPEFFPNASDVTLIMDREGKVLFVLVEQGGIEKFYVSGYFVPSVCE